MKIEELRRYVQLGKMPVPVFIKNAYSGIHVVIRISKNNVVFLDYEDNVSTEGNLRITFKFKTFEDMVYSIEEYTGVNIETLNIVDELCKYSSASDGNWQ